MGNDYSKDLKDLDKDDYEIGCTGFNDEYIQKQKDEIDLEKAKKEINNKFVDKSKKEIVYDYIKKFLEKEKKVKILNKIQDVFVYLCEKYDEVHRKENDDEKKFSENVDEKEKNIINAIYISKILDNDSIKIHDYAVYLYGEDVVDEIEKGNDKNIDEDFKKYNDDDFDITEDEKDALFNEICKEKNIDPENYDKKEYSSPKKDANESINNKGHNNKTDNISEKKENNEHDDNLNNNAFKDEDLFEYYDIIFDIDSLENLKINGWHLMYDAKGYDKYEKKKDKKNTVVSVIGNKNKGKSFILAKLSNLIIPDGHNITTKGLSVIYPEYEEKNIIFLDTAGFEIPLCENDEIFKFKTTNENYLKLIEEGKKDVSIKDYLTEDEFITQTMQFTRDRQNTDYFLQKFILESADILLCIVNQLNLSDHKFLNRIQEENKDKKIFVIHNLKTLKEIEDVDNYIKDILLKLVTSKLQKGYYIQIEDEKKKNNKKKENNIYYKQVFDGNENINREVIHLFMANDGSEAGDFYNNSTLEFIKNQIISFSNNKRFPIIEKVKDFLFDHSEEFFNVGLKKKEELEIMEENGNKILKYTGEPYELKECYIDVLGNANFIQSNYKPSYRAYKVRYKDENGESIKLIIDIEISGEVETENIKNPEIDNKDKKNIITISGNRNLKPKKKNNENDNSIKPTIKNIAENKASYFNDKNSIFNLRIYIPNDICIIGSLYERDFNEEKGLYRYIFNIQDKNNNGSPMGVEVDSDDDDDYDM